MPQHRKYPTNAARQKAYRRRHRPLTPGTLRKHAKRAHLEAQPTGQTVVVTPTVRLLCQDIRHVSAAELTPGSLDCIITDPPYDLRAIQLYDALGAFSATYLRVGGSLVVLCGQLYFPQVLTALGAHLAYKWLLSWYLPGNRSSKIWPRRVLSKWKPIVLYGKEPWTPPSPYGDVFCAPSVDPATRTAYHPWGQEPEAMRELVRRFATPGAVVADPFVGGGATAVACVEEGCNFIGIDIDVKNIEMVKARLAAYVANQPRPAA
jgi:hypothetical protein